MGEIGGIRTRICCCFVIIMATFRHFFDIDKNCTFGAGEAIKILVIKTKGKNQT